MKGGSPRSPPTHMLRRPRGMMKSSRGDHSIHFTEIRNGFKSFDPSIVFFEPPQRTDGIADGPYEPLRGKITGVYRHGKYLFAVPRGFIPRWNVFKGERNTPFFGWERLFRVAITKRVASKEDIERRFAVHLHPRAKPLITIRRSEDANIYNKDPYNNNLSYS